MDQQEMIAACVKAGMKEDWVRIQIANAPYQAEEWDMKPIETMSDLMGMWLYSVRCEMLCLLNTENPAHFGMAAYDASSRLHDIYLLSCIGVVPTKQADLFLPEKETGMATPLYVIQALAAVRESGNINMLDRRGVTMMVNSPRAAEWLDKASDSQYMDALNDMGAAESDDWMSQRMADLDDESE